jgi:hypothetical protein
MSRLFKTLVLLAGFVGSCTLASQALADDLLAPPGSDVSKIKLNNPDNLYVGVGLFNDMLNANVEMVTGWGNFMVRAGRFHNVGEGLAANMSWRRPLKLEDAKGSGYYVGLFGGQVSGDVLDAETYQRLGGGAEMGYHWVSDYTRAELTVGLGAAQAKENELTGNKLPCSPTLFLNLNIALGY